MTKPEEAENLINPKKEPTKQFFLELLDDGKQREAEDSHIGAVKTMLKALYIVKLKKAIEAARAEKQSIISSPDYNAETYKRVLELNARISLLKKKTETYKPFFTEPYFARMDLTDHDEGYNAYYIGKHGDSGLEIVDWRAPVAQKYYQKSRTSFNINGYDYKLILRRAIRTHNGKVIDYKNEYLNLSDYLTKEEIGGRDEALIFDPFLKEILKSRKEKEEITDIIETIQEKQYEIITLPENKRFILQGVAGSGKTMVMLHRLSYIMYNNEAIRNSDVLVLTPSDSFNAFIDELSAVLGLEKVKTSTLDSYFMTMLKNAGVDIYSKTDMNAAVPAAYLGYIYSDAFLKDVDKKLSKIYGGIHGMFSSKEAEDTVNNLMEVCSRQTEGYEKIKNSSVRVRRCVLGEIKEKPDGGLYYTKQFRNMFNCVLDTAEFLRLVKQDARMNEYAFFYRQLLSFYKSVNFLRRYAYKICLSALEDLRALKAAAEREIAEFKRYKTKIGNSEVLTFAESVEKRERLISESSEIEDIVLAIQNGFTSLNEFADIIRGYDSLVSIGKCENTADVLRFFYRETVKKYKAKFGVTAKTLVKSDPFCLCLLLNRLGYDLYPKYAFLFVDEAQDISPAEYGVLDAVNDRAVFNVFGDLRQNITGYRGIRDWGELGAEVMSLNLNYRNTNQIVDFVSSRLGIEMKSIGLNGSEVTYIDKQAITGYLSAKSGLKAVICSENNFEKLKKRSYNAPYLTGKISKTKINIMTVYQSKGLEFTSVVVADEDMSDNEKYIAYTRALKELAIVKKL